MVSFKQGPDNPFGLSDVGLYSAPTFAYIDGDGDLDTFIGEQHANTYFFQNNGSFSSPKFAAPQTNPFGLSNVASFSKPTFTDIDSDGDLDAFIGANDGNTLFFQNTGSSNSPKFAAPQTTPFDLSQVGDASAPTFVDIDGDGDLDAFIGVGDGNTRFFQNNGSSSSPRFATAVTNPFGLSNVGNDSAPTFDDIDRDEDLDAFLGDSDGNTFFFQNTGSFSSPSFAAPQTNPFDLKNVGNYSHPTFADIDADGDLDAFIGSGNSSGATFFFQNTPTVSSTPPLSGAGNQKQLTN